MVHKQRPFLTESEVEAMEAALVELVKFCLSGERYKSRNPYGIPEIVAALNALGYDPAYENDLFGAEED